MSMETELKLRFNPTDVETLLQHPIFATARPLGRQELYATYYDTPDRALLKIGVGMRVRLEKDCWIQTVKTAGVGLAGLHQRREWNVQVENERPVYQALPGELRESGELNKKLFNKLQPLFNTEFQRDAWEFRDDHGNCVEIALDQGRIQAGDAVAPISEIELELKEGGEVSALYHIAGALLDSVPLNMENASKAQRGHALCDPKPSKPRKAGKLALNHDMDTEEAFIYMAWDCLNQWQANEPAVMEGIDPEGVHQMRVGLRRLRSLLSLYKPLIPPEGYADLREELRWVAGSLGPARDWDVFAENLEHIRAGAPENSELEDLTKKVAAIQAKSYTLAQETLRSTRHTRLLLVFSEWLARRQWRESMNKEQRKQLGQPVDKFAARILGKRHKQVRRKGRNLLELSPEERHQVRIASKKLAYGSRFFLNLYPGQTSKSYVAALSDLRDDLGLLNDAAVAGHLLDDLGLAVEAPVRHFLHGWYASQNQIILARLGKTWDRFLDQEPFWK